MQFTLHKEIYMISICCQRIRTCSQGGTVATNIGEEHCRGRRAATMECSLGGKTCRFPTMMRRSASTAAFVLVAITCEGSQNTHQRAKPAAALSAASGGAARRKYPNRLLGLGHSAVPPLFFFFSF